MESDAFKLVLQIQEAMQDSVIQSVPKHSGSLGEVAELGAGDSMQDPTPVLRAQHQKVQQEKTKKLLQLHELISKTPAKLDTDVSLGESNQPPTGLHTLLNPTSDQADPIEDVMQYLKGVSSVTPRQMSDLRHFYIEQTAKALKQLHGESHNILRRYAHKELKSLADENLSFEGLSVGVQKGLDKSKTALDTVENCLHESSRLCKFLSDIQHIKAHPWRDAWSPRDEARAEALLRLHQSESEVSDGIEELMARVERGLPIDETDTAPETTVAHHAKPKPAPEPKPAKARKKKVHAPMAQVGSHLKQLILTKLTSALHIMQDRNHQKKPLGPKHELALNALLKEITTHVMEATLSYAQWGDEGSLSEEKHAVTAGDPDRLSKHGHRSQPMDSNKIVKHFLLRGAEHRWKPRTIPTPILKLVEHGVRLPSGGVIQVHIGEVAQASLHVPDHDVDLTESNEYKPPQQTSLLTNMAY